MANFKDLLCKFVKFGVVGFSGMIVDYAFLFLFKERCGFPDWLALALAFALAASSNYILNRLWTFRSKEQKIGREYLRFFAVSLVGLGITELTMWLLGLWLPDWAADWRFYLLKFVAIVITTLWNFFGNLLFTFKNKS